MARKAVFSKRERVSEGVWKERKRRVVGLYVGCMHYNTTSHLLIINNTQNQRKVENRL